MDINKLRTEAIFETPLWRYTSYLSWITFFSVAANLLLLSMPLYLAQLYDRVLPSSSVDTLLYLSLFALFCLALWGATEILRSDVSHKLSVRYELDTAPDLLKHGLTQSKTKTQEHAARLEDVATVRQMAGSRAFIGLFDLPFAPIFLFILFVIHPALGLVTCMGCCLLVGMTMANDVISRRVQAHSLQLYRSTGTSRAQLLQNSDDIRAMGMGRGLIQRWFSNLALATFHANRTAAINGQFFGAVRFTRQAIQISILGCGAYLVLSQNLSAGLIFASSIISGRALMPIEQFIGSWRQLVAARLAYRRIESFLDSVEPENTPDRQFEMPDIQGFLNCRNVTVIVPGVGQDMAILRNISFTASPGETIAIVGPSGSGKSTLLRVLSTIIRPTSGVLEYDDFDARYWSPEQIGKSIGYSGQTISFFAGTIAENIARFSENPKDEDVIEAAECAGAHTFIGSLPGGYSMMLDQANVALSSGQQQRIALARAFYGNPKFLFLDEPDSHLDQDGERALQKAISDAKERGQVVLFSSHRMNMINCADKILVLLDGAVAQYGSRSDLLGPKDPSDVRLRDRSKQALRLQG